MANNSTNQTYGLLKSEDDPRSKDEIASMIVQRHPIELEDPVRTYDSPLVIECTCPSWQPREWPPAEAYPDGPPGHYEEGGVRYPPVPCSVEDQAQELIDAAAEGCAATHVHPRDPEDCLGTDRVDLLSDIYDRVCEETDVIPIQHTWTITDDGGIDYVGPAKEKLAAAEGDPDYVEASIVLWPPADTYPNQYVESVREGLEFYYENGIKPVHKVRGSYHTRRLQREIVEPGDADEDDQLVIVHDMGHPFGWPMNSETWMPIEMISSIQQTRERFPNAKIGVYFGNRNWLPVTLTAIMLGVDIVRIGIEDLYWMYPHRDEIIQETIECIRKVTQFCELIGREVAGPEQAREILGV
jgi:uncharacterized protein (DUF849 family)